MTLTYKYIGAGPYGNQEVITNYIAATAVDSTDPVNGKAIDNRDGRITYVAVSCLVTDKSGTSPTLQLNLQGSDDEGVTWSTLSDTGGNAIQTSALDISSADSVNVAGFVDTVQKPRASFPSLIRVQGDLGGSSTPKWKGGINVTIDRDPRNRGTLLT